MTDNKVYVSQDGTESVCCSRADGIGFDFLNQLEFPTLIVSTERNPVVSARAKKLRCRVLQDTHNKVESLNAHCETMNIDPTKIMFVGNDVNDIPVMRHVAYPVAVADAYPEVLNIAWHVLRTAGGQGVVREIIGSVIKFPPLLEVLGQRAAGVSC